MSLSVPSLFLASNESDSPERSNVNSTAIQNGPRKDNRVYVELREDETDTSRTEQDAEGTREKVAGLKVAPKPGAAA